MSMAQTVFIWLVLLAHLMCLVKMMPAKVKTHTSAVDYLKAYGYLPPEDKYSDERISGALSTFQRYHRLKKTGSFTKETMKLMMQPRCGEKDVTNVKLHEGETKKTYNLTMFVESWSANMSQVFQKSAIFNSISNWNKIVTLHVLWNSKSPDIVFIFNKDLTPNNPPKAGGARVLTKIKKKNGTNYIYIDIRATLDYALLQRAVGHSIGHVLGWFHSEPNDIMSPILETSNIAKDMAPELFSARCRTTIEGAFSHMQDGLTYLFKADKFWRISNGYTMDKGYPKKLNSKWYGVPTHFDEGFVWAGNWNTYFFKGKYYYRYNNTVDRVDSQYPYLIRNGWKNVPDDIDAAFTDSSFETYFFKDDLVYLYDNALDTVAYGYPKNITDVYPNVPNNLDTVFRYYYDGYVYFFKGLYFWNWNAKLQRAEGPFAINKGWIDLCMV